MMDASWTIGHAKISYTHHTSPLTLNAKSGSKTSLSDLVKKATPACRLNPLLFNGHLQTMWTAKPDPGPPIYYKRQIFESDHAVYPGQFAVDFVIPPPTTPLSPDPTLPERTTYYSEKEWTTQPSTDKIPMLICLHGLSGGSHEVYLRHVLAPLTASGWSACVINARGCALSKLTTPYLFNARATWDIRQLIHYLSSMYPNRPLYGIGFSLGANILTNYVAEEGEKCVLKMGIAVSNPWNLELSHHALRRSWIGMRVYQKVMAKGILRLYEGNREEMLRSGRFTDGEVMACRYLFEFDRVAQTVTWGYPTVGAYHRDASSVDAVTAIRIPFVGINATDDPISAKEGIPYDEFKTNPYTVLLTTNWGGHLSWFEVGGGRWFAKAVAAILTKMENDVGSVEKAHVAFMGTAEGEKHYPVWDPSHRRLHVPI